MIGKDKFYIESDQPIDTANQKEELEKELVNILDYWMQHAVDEQCGGFYGKIDNDNRVDTNAPKGLVLNARILWSFSAAYNYTKKEQYLVRMAERLHHRAGHRALAIEPDDARPGDATRADQFQRSQKTNRREPGPGGQRAYPKSWKAHRRRRRAGHAQRAMGIRGL